LIFLTQENELIWDKKYQVLYFYATWMAFNKKYIIMLDNFTDNLPNISLFAIDIDYFKGLCRRFDITNIPTVLIMKNGKEIKRIQGITHSQGFAAIFDDI
jgi:thioredoxin 1